jgi:hypothetical protein
MARDSLPKLFGTGSVARTLRAFVLVVVDFAGATQLAFAGRSTPTTALSVDVGALEIAVSRGRDCAESC